MEVFIDEYHVTIFEKIVIEHNALLYFTIMHYFFYNLNNFNNHLQPCVKTYIIHFTYNCLFYIYFFLS